MNDNQIDKMIDLLGELLRWTKFQGMIKLKEVILLNVKTENEKKIFELSDGRAMTEIAGIVGVSHVTVYNYWQRWSKTGIVEPSKKYKGRYERMVSLLDMGVEVPRIEVPKTAQISTTKENVIESAENDTLKMEKEKND